MRAVTALWSITVQEAVGVGQGDGCGSCVIVSSAQMRGVPQSTATLWQREPGTLWLGV